jgi:hypothetical protein
MKRHFEHAIRAVGAILGANEILRSPIARRTSSSATSSSSSSWSIERR